MKIGIGLKKQFGVCPLNNDSRNLVKEKETKKQDSTIATKADIAKTEVTTAKETNTKDIEAQKKYWNF